MKLFKNLFSNNSNFSATKKRPPIHVKLGDTRRPGEEGKPLLQKWK